MALVTLLVVGIGGAAGAVSRYAVSMAVDRRGGDVLLVNVAGSFALGVVLGAGIGDHTQLALGVGFCGAFTTFSSFAVETVRLLEDGDRAAAAAYAGGTLLFALLAVAGGSALGAALS
ncbi:CrcB family protein [Natronomonas sp. F2-12]|jgi:CrcB protein|uniref:Fluoride-specific ion channel FluC n=1 Tax=Natronomonas aquatica TaxID=2841590 RepID=A0A9R1D7H3_9EURY|nr:CrcB family protein [Natronomonas aquatica]MCQ4334837.1 CrcB family protein [Natronomonas aquatica]